MAIEVPSIDFIDLHVHTNASDGTFSPEKIVQLALELKLKAIAITDHDTVKSISRALEAAKNQPIEVIPGIEISTEYNSESIHILGLYINYNNLELLTLTNEILNAREIRAIKIIEKINELGKGPVINLEEVVEIANGLIGRPHLAQILVKKGYVQNINDAFNYYLKRGAPCYVPRFKLTPREAVKFLVKIKALPILAHPGYISEKIDLENILDELTENGLKGLEIYYPNHTKKQIKHFKKLAKKHNLFQTGGSDFHGDLKDGPLLGSLKIPFKLLKKIRKELKSNTI